MPINESHTNKYLGEKVNIPFYDRKRGEQIVKLKIKRTKLGANSRNADHPNDLSPSDKEFIKNRSAKRFIAHYFPEFYTFLYDQQLFSTFVGANLDVAQDLKDSIKENITIGRIDDSATPGRIIIVTILDYDIEKKRESIKSAHCLPSFEDNLTFFNEQQEITNILSEATFAIGTIGQTNSSLNDGLNAFNTQMAGLEGQLQFNPNMGMLANTTQSALSLAITLVASQLKANSPSYKFGAADSMTMYFGQQENSALPGGSQVAVGRIEYLKVEESITPQPMKIGYFSNIRYNNSLKDPLTLITLKNYDSILASITAGGAGGSSVPGLDVGAGGAGGSGFMDFMRNPEVQNALTPHELNPSGSASSIFNPLPPLTPPDPPGNPFINAAKELTDIDIENTKELEKGFKTAFTSAQLKALKAKVADNPAVFTKVMNKEKSKNLQKAVDVTKVVENVLETGPLGFMEKNAQVNNFLKMFGIKDLAKEAFMCLTLGLNFEVGRIAGAVKRSLTKAQAGLYQPPDQPRAGGDIRKPYINPDDQPKMFTITGDIWKQILDVVIDTLQQTVLEMIKKLGDLLKYNCPLNNPRSEDFGANDIADLIDPSLQTPALAGSGSALDRVSANLGLSPAELMLYLSSVSQILSSMDICSLFTRRATVGPEILDRIIEFNRDYPLPYVSGYLTTYSTVLAFFAEISLMVDVTDLCNEVINEVYFANEENINFCLTPGNLPTVDVQDVVDMMENGINLEFPELNFDCPDKANFINDPTITISVPELFNTLTQLVELQFVESAESVKTIMLEQKFTSEANGSLMQAFIDAGLNYEANGWPPSMDPNIMAQIIKALDAIAGFDLSSCDVDVSQILGFDAAAVASIGQDVTAIVADTMSDPAFVSAIEEIKNTLMGIGGPPGSIEPLPIFPSYRFNTEFLKEFINYIEIDELSSANSNVTVPKYFNSRAVDDARLYVTSSTGTPLPPNPDEAKLPITDGSYKPIEINFGFPISTPFLFGTLEGSTLASYGDLISPDYIATGVGEQLDCRNQSQINQTLNMGGNVPMGHGCDGTTHGPADPEHGGDTTLDDYEIAGPTCTNQKHIVAKVVYDLVHDIPDTVVAGSTLPAFQSAYPLIYNQIRYSASALKLVPLNEVTPGMLNSVQSYMQSNLDNLLNNGYLDALIIRYETSQSCTLLAPDDFDEGIYTGMVTPSRPAVFLYDSIMAKDVDDLSAARSYLKIVYPREAPENPNIYVDFESAGDYIPRQQILEDISRSTIAQDFETEENNIQNTYIQPFVDAFAGTMNTNVVLTETPDDSSGIPTVGGGNFGVGEDVVGPTDLLTAEQKALIESQHFPTVYALLVDNMFNYLIANGVFDAVTLQSLKLFHLNEHCPPAEVRDLLDIEGIMEQMKSEYVQAMCNDKPELEDRAIIRNVVKYGMYLLITQMQIAAIFIKNIFVLSAFEIDSLVENKDSFIFKFIRKQITTALLTFLINSENQDESTVRRDLVGYFNLKIRRQAVVAQGGIRNANGDVVFPTGTTFSVVDNGAFVGFDEILDYLISERLLLGAVPVANAIRSSVEDNNPVPLDLAMLASLQTFTVADERRVSLTAKVQAYYGDTPDTPRIFLTRKYTTLSSGITRARLRLWYYYGGEDPNLVNIFTFPGTIPAFGQPNASATMMEAIRAGLIEVESAALGHGLTGDDGEPCLSQYQINQTLAWGGTVQQGRGCPGTTHSGISGDSATDAQGEEEPDVDGGGTGFGSGNPGFGN